MKGYAVDPMTNELSICNWWDPVPTLAVKCNVLIADNVIVLLREMRMNH